MVLDVGRKPLLLFGIGGCCVWLCVEAAATAIYTADESKLNYGKLGVAAFYMFNVCYNIGVNLGGNVFYAEVFPNHIRHMGVSLTNAVLALADLIYLEVTPIAFASVGYKFFLVSTLQPLWSPASMLLTAGIHQVFICISFVGFCILLIILPETKGLALEEIGQLFGDAEEVALYQDPNISADTAEDNDRDSGSGKHSGDDMGDVEKGIGETNHEDSRHVERV